MGSNMLLCTLLVKYNGLLGPSGIVYLTKIVKQPARPNVETDVLPVLRKQNGFRDEITFLAENYEVANSTFHKIAARK